MCIQGYYLKTVKRARGWRRWDLGRTARGAKLEPTMGYGGSGKAGGMDVWKTRCAKMHNNGGKVSEHTNGGFGLHAVTAPSIAGVFGIVSLYGDVAVFCDEANPSRITGYLASNAKIERLYVDERSFFPRARAKAVAKALRRRYRVPVEIVHYLTYQKLVNRVQAQRERRWAAGKEA